MPNLKRGYPLLPVFVIQDMTVAEAMAKAESSRTVPLPSPRMTQALFSPSAYVAKGMIALIHHALSKEFLEGGR